MEQDFQSSFAQAGLYLFSFSLFFFLNGFTQVNMVSINNRTADLSRLEETFKII